MGVWVVVAQEGRRDLHVMVDGHLDVGRECDGLLLHDERVSRQHLRLDLVGEGIVVSDLGSSNGTFLDGVRLQAPVALELDSTVRLGSTSIRLSERPGPSADFDRRRRPTGMAATRTNGTLPLPPADHTIRQTGIELVARAVAEQGTAVSAHNGHDDDTVTILFSDIESSTELATALGDERWYHHLSAHNEIVEGCVASGGGRVVKNQGDGYMATFSSARRALLTAAAIQHRLTDDEWVEPNGASGPGAPISLRVRIGCHTGEAIRHDNGDLFGQHVIIASRVADLARGGEVLVSSIAKEITATRGDLLFGEARSVGLKGIAGTQLVYELDWSRVVLPVSVAR